MYSFSTVVSRTAHRPYARALTRFALRTPKLVCLAGDRGAAHELRELRALTRGRCVELHDSGPELLAVAAEIEASGSRPWVHLSAGPSTRRFFQELVDAGDSRSRRLRLIGVVRRPDGQRDAGATVVDDVALMRIIPGLTVLDVGDATEARCLPEALDEVDGPVYCHVLGGDVPVLFESPLEVGRARPLSRGRDLCLVSSSTATWDASEAATLLRRLGIRVAHLHVSTVKPLDDPAVPEAIATTLATVSVENGPSDGGLGGAVAELIAAHGLGRPLVRLGLGQAGGAERRLGASIPAIVAAAEKALGGRLGGVRASPHRRTSAEAAHLVAV